MTLTLRIEHDETPMGPREWDNLGTMVCFHRKYSLGDETDLRSGNFSGWDDLENHLRKELGARVILPLYLYDHSGITMSTSPFTCPWDSGQVGFIYATAEAIRKGFEVKRITKKTLEKAQRCLEAEVETYDQFITGEVYGFIVEDENGEEIDSCWGYFGREHAEHEGNESLRYHEKEAA